MKFRSHIIARLETICTVMSQVLLGHCLVQTEISVLVTTMVEQDPRTPTSFALRWTFTEGLFLTTGPIVVHSWRSRFQFDWVRHLRPAPLTPSFERVSLKDSCSQKLAPVVGMLTLLQRWRLSKQGSEAF